MGSLSTTAFEIASEAVAKASRTRLPNRCTILASADILCKKTTNHFGIQDLSFLRYDMRVVSQKHHTNTMYIFFQIKKKENAVILSMKRCKS